MLWRFLRSSEEYSVPVYRLIKINLTFIWSFSFLSFSPLCFFPVFLSFGQNAEECRTVSFNYYLMQSYFKIFKNNGIGI